MTKSLSGLLKGRLSFLLGLLILNSCDEVPVLPDYEMEQGVVYKNGEEVGQYRGYYVSLSYNKSQSLLSIMDYDDFSTIDIAYEGDGYQDFKADSESIEIVVLKNETISKGGKADFTGNISFSEVDYHGYVTINGAFSIFDGANKDTIVIENYKIKARYHNKGWIKAKAINLQNNTSLEHYVRLYSTQPIYFYTVGNVSVTNAKFYNFPKIEVSDTTYLLSDGDWDYKISVFDVDCEMIDQDPLKVDVYDIQDLPNNRQLVFGKIYGELKDSWWVSSDRYYVEIPFELNLQK